MADRRADWSLLRGTLVVFVLSVLAAAALIVGSHRFQQSMEQEYRANHARFRQASAQYLAVDEEERIIDEFYPDFVRLYQAGLIGRERRLSWLETLRAANRSIGLPDLTYKIEAQRTQVPEFSLSLGGFELLVSPMTLNVGLLHEGDLLALFEMLDRDARGQYTVRACALGRTDASGALAAAAANLAAECTLEWLTLDLGGEAELAL